jgi:hypothetical protein
MTVEEKDAVRQQMERILLTTHFRNSRRYPALFRFLVEETLEGRGELLKERLLGVQVFGRPADYDTASDPIVRVTIAEIRKRIAQYYHEEAHESEMRIELTPGSYEPEFRPRRETGNVAAAVAAAVGEQTAEVKPLRQGKWWRRAAAGALCAAALVCAGGLGWRWLHPSAMEELWAPVLGGHKTITFCLPAGVAKDDGATATAAGIVPPDLADPNAATVAARTPTFLDYETLGENVVFSDALAALRISNWMAVPNRELRYRLTSSTTLDDLRQGPNVLIGGLDNHWTLRAISHLPYRFGGADRGHFWIQDTKDPSNHDLGLNLTTQWGAVTRDYAIIARIHDDATGQVEVIVAGIGMCGTAAAGEFLIDAKQVERLRQSIGPSFKDHDFEAVLSTDVVEGVAGAPKILKTAVW